jgi:uncharacterized protein YbjT (DUF2867 family)
MYVILGATGNIGAMIANTLMARGEKIRVVGRDRGRLSRFSTRGAEAITTSIEDTEALTKAFSGARAAFLMIPPAKSAPDYRVVQEHYSDSIRAAAHRAGLQYAVNLSSFGAQAAAGTGPIAGLHSAENKLNSIEKLNVLHIRAGYFMEGHLQSIGLIQGMGITGGAINPDLKIPHIAKKDVANYAAERLLQLDFSGKQTRELLGERDLTLNEATAIIGRGIAKPDLHCRRFAYEQVKQVLKQSGIAEKTADQLIEMYKGINNGTVTTVEPRSPENTTPTSFETFVQDVFVPAYKGQAASA